MVRQIYWLQYLLSLCISLHTLTHPAPTAPLSQQERYEPSGTRLFRSSLERLSWASQRKACSTGTKWARLTNEFSLISIQASLRTSHLSKDNTCKSNPHTREKNTSTLQHRYAFTHTNFIHTQIHSTLFK